MITRAQEKRVEDLAVKHGRVLVNHGFVNGDVEVVTEHGQRLIVYPWPMGSEGMAAMVDCGVTTAFFAAFAEAASA